MQNPPNSNKSWLRDTAGIRIVLIALCALLTAPAGLGQNREQPAEGQQEGQKERKWNLRRVERLKDYRDESGRVRPDLWKQGIDHARRMKLNAGVSRVPGSAALKAGPKALTGAGITGVQWVQVGPQPAFPIEGIVFQGNGAMSGEVLDIAIDPRGLSDQVIYSASNDGGIWRSTDGGATFQPKTDNMPSLSMGAVVLDPANPSIVYAGTGNLFDGSPQNTLQAVKAVGIYRSIDMGESWTVLNPNGIFTGNGIARMAMPAANVLLVATPNGLYKSVNGGMSFGVAPAYNNGQPVLFGDVEDIDLDATTPNTTIYACVNGQGIFLSTDAGDTFPTNLFTNANGSPEDGVIGGNYAFVRMAQAASMPSWLYATVQENANNVDGDADGFAGLYLSTDTGANWARMAAADATGADNGGCQCGYDQTIGVDPRDHMRVLIGFQELYLSTDGAGSFGIPAVSQNKTHWDHHYIGFSPPTHWGGLGAGDTTPMWTGTDGGIHSTSDGGATFNNFHNSTIATNLFHHIDIGRGSAANNDWTYGGTQDTGTLHSCAAVGSCGGAALGSGAVPWEMGNNGDGSGVAVDPTNPMRAYSVRNAGYRFTNNGGTTWINPAAGPTVPPSAWRFAIDANDTTRVWLITGTVFRPLNQLWRSNDATGTNWSPINTFMDINGGRNIRAIANTATDSNVLWFGGVDGQVENTTNATAAAPTFSGPITIPGNPNNIVSEIAINPLNSAEVVVTYRGLCGAACANTDNRMRRIFQTTDAGATWNDISGTDGNPVGNLPNLPTHSVVYDIGTSPPSIIVANDAGVMRSSNNGATWERFGLGLPTADSKMLKIDHGVDPPLLRVGTYGRSVWELSEAQGPILAVNGDLGFDTVCIGERQTRVVQLFNVGSEDLVINAFFRASGSTQFKIISGPPAPVLIPPGEEIDYTIEFSATEGGEHTATFQINSNDQFTTTFELQASGTVNTQMIALSIADSGSFGDVCNDDIKDLGLTISNVGCGELTIDAITLTGTDAADFELPNVDDLPLTILAGTATELPLRFSPTGGSCGDVRTATVNVFNDDPDASPKSISISGVVPCPDLNVTILNSGDFGNVCFGDMTDLNLELFNQGKCDLTIDSITLDTGTDFILPADLQFPLVLSPDASKDVPVKFLPDPEVPCSDTDPRTDVIVIDSDSLGGAADAAETVEISGFSKCPNLTIDPPLNGVLAFDPTVADVQGVVDCSTVQQDVIAIRNTGFCPLEITDISSSVTDFEVDSPTNFTPPIVLPPGEETLTVDIRFRPQTGLDETGPTEIVGDLLVSSNDPDAADGVAEDFLCGEGVLQSGVRLVVLDTTLPAVTPLEEVDKLNLMSHGLNTPSPINIRLTDVELIDGLTICGEPVAYHIHNERLPSTGTTGNNPNSSYVADAKEGNLQGVLTFSLGQCEFRVDSLQLRSSRGIKSEPENREVGRTTGGRSRENNP